MFSIWAGREPSHVCCRIQLVVLYHFRAWSGLHRLNFALYFYLQPGVLFRGLRLGPFSFSTMRLPPIASPSASPPAALHSPYECRRRCTRSLSPSFWPWSDARSNAPSAFLDHQASSQFRSNVIQQFVVRQWMRRINQDVTEQLVVNVPVQLLHQLREMDKQSYLLQKDYLHKPFK